MADVGIGPWGEEHTFHAPVFVVTHRLADMFVKRGATSCILVTEGLDDALTRAREAAGHDDVLVNGGTLLLSIVVSVAALPLLVLTRAGSS